MEPQRRNMPLSLLRRLHSLFLYAVWTILACCSQVDPVEEGLGTQKAQNNINGKKANVSEVTEMFTDEVNILSPEQQPDQSELSTTPIVITGSYLTCRRHTSETHANDKLITCNLAMPEKVKKTNPRIEWDVQPRDKVNVYLDPKSSSLSRNIALKDPSPENLKDIIVSVKLYSFEFFHQDVAKLEQLLEGNAAKPESAISPIPVSLEDMPNHALNLIGNNIHVGSGASPDLFCSEVYQIFAMGKESVSTPVPLKFTVDTSKFTLIFLGVCGIKETSTNSIRIFDSEGLLVKSERLNPSSKFLILDVEAKPGEFTLDVQTEETLSETDNFTIRFIGLSI